MRLVKPFNVVYGQKPETFTSNQELLDALASATELPPKKADFIGMQIKWWDGGADGKGSCTMCFATGISGGRLGRDHQLVDVPIHYFRDRLMDYIAVNLPEDKQDKQEAARTAICPELTDAEIEEYARLIAQERWEIEKPEREAAERWRKAQGKPGRRHRGAAAPLQTMVEAKHMEGMQAAMLAVDADIDLRHGYPPASNGTPNYPRCWSDQLSSRARSPCRRSRRSNINTPWTTTRIKSAP